MSLPCPRSNETHTYIYIYRHFYPTNFLPYLSVTKLTNFTNISETGPEAIRGYVSKQTTRSGQGLLCTSKGCMPDRDLALEISALAAQSGWAAEICVQFPVLSRGALAAGSPLRGGDGFLDGPGTDSAPLALVSKHSLSLWPRRLRRGECGLVVCAGGKQVSRCA